jgi:TetR/AcrR family transcriptional regulator, cholesterol catabolism regulator
MANVKSSRGARPSRVRQSTVPVPEASERRQVVMATAANLFAERGYKSTTVREIADVSGVLPGSLYHYFDSKESIIDELLSGYLDELLTNYRAIMAEKAGAAVTLGRLVSVAFGSFDQHRAAITVLQNERYDLAQLPRLAYLNDRETEVERMWSGVIKQGIKKGEFRADADPKIIYRFVRDGVWAAGRWYRTDGRLTPEQLAEQFLMLLLNGLSA